MEAVLPVGGGRNEQKKAERFHLSLSLFVPSFNSFENIINFTKIHSGKGDICGGEKEHHRAAYRGSNQNTVFF